MELYFPTLLKSHDNGARHNAVLPGVHDNEPSLHNQKGQQEGDLDQQLPLIFK